MSIARDLTRWQGFLLTCPDEMFFDIMRTALGNIQTPFNKHSLTKKLIAYLRRQETKDRVLALITDQDAHLLTVIFVLDEPDLASLYTFLQDSHQYLELHSHLLNLEERMLIYRFNDNGTVRIQFNPVLFDPLKDHVIDSGRVFASQDATQRSGSPTWLNDLLIASIVAYLRENPSPFKAGGKPKKRVENDLRERFSSIGPSSAVFERVRLVMDGLEAVGILEDHESGVKIGTGNLLAFSSTGALDRLALIAGGIWQRRNYKNASLVECAASVLFLIANLQAGRAYTGDSVKRLLVAGGRLAGTDAGVPGLLDAMCQLGLLIGDGEEVCRAPQADEFTGGIDEPQAVVQPNYEVTLKPSASFADSLELALMSKLQTYDFFPVFELTRESVTRRLSDGMRSEQLLDLLERLGGGPPSPNVVFSIDSWEKEYLSVKLFSGPVLLVDPARRHLVEHSEAMSDLIVSIPAPGVYLLSTNDTDLIEKALHDCGIDQTPASEGPIADVFGSPKPAPIRIPTSTIHTNAPVGAPAGDDEDRLIQELTSRLKSMNIDQDGKRELTKLIDKRLILYPEQLDYYSTAPKEKTEARGFDYVGKIRIIEQTLVRDDLLLEVTNRDSGGKSVKYLVKPTELQKSGNDLDLYCIELPGKSELKMRVRTMSLVRAVRGSLFVVS
jgi:hypothetical protein